MEYTTMSIPTIPTIDAMLIFALLFILLVQREVRYALGHPGSRRWRIASDSLIGLLVVVYGFILLSRFLDLLY